MEAPDNTGRSRLWLAPLDHSAPLRQVPNVEGGEPHFGPDGEIFSGIPMTPQRWYGLRRWTMEIRTGRYRTATGS